MPPRDRRLAAAVQHFWETRRDQSQRARPDQGKRTSVTGGAHLDGFTRLVKEILVESELPDAHVYIKEAKEEGRKTLPRKLAIPGFFRAEKEWDLLVVLDGLLLASLEFKSQVGSFGNNYNNRSEEAVGNAYDFHTAFRQGAFGKSPQPWLGYFMLLEDAPGSSRPVRLKEPHFSVRQEFVESSYAKRYELLCLKLVRERLYNAACFILSGEEGGLKGNFREPHEELTFERLVGSLAGHALGYARSRRR